ncbi:Plant transposon protein [Seminavis robusta]|uniref:Plant transposon protein n=1 Tax=Seminavis robusta TaxID=568900 RepID=A0A9N8DB94_9STRA|nr:Plant transposon protein [Seminavis robusta]|eukprot:Sro6_g005350.1 Plant transposon protein (564) ;mRNA; r:163214-164905
MDMETPTLDQDEYSSDEEDTCLADCYDGNGAIIADKLIGLLQREDDLDDAEESMLHALYHDAGEEDQYTDVATAGHSVQSQSNTKRQCTPRKCKSIKPYYFDAQGRKVTLQPKQTVWYYMYVASPTIDCTKWHKKFRRRFRMPYSEFLSLFDRLETHTDYFGRWQSKDAVGKESSPLELLLLGALRYLGRGLTFDDLEEYTAINEETHRQFLHKFIKFGAEVLYPLYVVMPRTAEELKPHRKEYNTGGLHGCGFSTDATNVVMWRCSHNLKQANMGFKQSHPARTYNLTCNHRRQILYTTKGHPSRWNDKTLVLFDEFLTGLHEGTILSDVTYRLYSWEGEAGNSQVEYANYSGAWGLVDNGYHKWACTQAPTKTSLLRSEERLSEWIESFRKDAECCFGILKGRFRVLKTGIRLEGPEAADRIWLTCCALHNLLLKADGLDEWIGSAGDNQLEDMRRYAPFAVQRLSDEALRNFGSRNHEQMARQEESLRRGINEQRDEAMAEDERNNPPMDDCHLTRQKYAMDGSIILNSLTYDDFRNRLVEHFDILWRRNRVRWPQRKNT